METFESPNNVWTLRYDPGESEKYPWRIRGSNGYWNGYSNRPAAVKAISFMDPQATKKQDMKASEYVRADGTWRLLMPERHVFPVWQLESPTGTLKSFCSASDATDWLFKNTSGPGRQDATPQKQEKQSMNAYKAIVWHTPNEKAQREGQVRKIIWESGTFAAEDDGQAWFLAGLEFAPKFNGEMPREELTVQLDLFGDRN